MDVDVVRARLVWHLEGDHLVCLPYEPRSPQRHDNVVEVVGAECADFGDEGYGWWLGAVREREDSVLVLVLRSLVANARPQEGDVHQCVDRVGGVRNLAKDVLRLHLRPRARECPHVAVAQVLLLQHTQLLHLVHDGGARSDVYRFEALGRLHHSMRLGVDSHHAEDLRLAREHRVPQLQQGILPVDLVLGCGARHHSGWQTAEKRLQMTCSAARPCRTGLQNGLHLRVALDLAQVFLRRLS